MRRSSTRDDDSPGTPHEDHSPPGDPATRLPAIWLYPQREIDVEIRLTFHGRGIMTFSRPPYNDLWRIHIDPSQPFDKYSSTFVNDEWLLFLDYDGLRDGPFQKASGWIVAKDDIVNWLKQELPTLGFSPSESDDITYSYARRLQESLTSQYVAIYPQTRDIVDKSVSLEVSPAPETTHRLWLYVVPVDHELSELSRPQLEPIQRCGFTVVEFGFLSDREIPEISGDSSKRTPAGNRLIACHAGMTPK